MIYDATGEYQQALDYYQEALTIRRAIGDRAGEGTTLHNIGGIYEATREYQQALDYYQEALTIFKVIGDRADEGTTLHNIGEVYEATGEYQQALDYYQEALTIRRAIGDRADEGTTLHNIGGIYEATGEYQQALGYYQEALTIRKAIGDRAGEGTTLNNIGMIYGATGEYQQALGYFQESLTIRRAIGDRAGEGATLNNIGKVYEATGEYQQALDYYQEALTIHKAISYRAGEGIALNNISMIYEVTGEYQQALASLQEALFIHKAIGYRSGAGATLNNIGAIYSGTGMYQQALSYLQEALTITKEIGDRAVEQKTLVNIGYVYEQQEQWREAVEYYQQVIALLEVIRSKAGSSEAKESFLGQWINVYLHIVQCLLQLNAPEEAFVYTERSKARSFLEQLYEASSGVKHGVDQQLLTEETNLYGKLSVIEQNLKKQLGDKRQEQLLKERHSLEHELSILEMKLRTSNLRYAELKYPQPVTVEQVQQEILKEGEVLVEYLQGEEEIYAFVLSKTEFSTYTLKINRKELGDKLLELLIPIHRGFRNEWDNNLAYQLYHSIFQPLEQAITEASQEEEVKSLIIVPDEDLYYLPFEILTTKDGETLEYLIDRYPITYAPSTSILKPEILHAHQPEQYAQDLLALAPFGSGETKTTKRSVKSTENQLLSDILRSGIEDVQPLPYSTEEVQNISNLYPQSVFRIGTDATKAYLQDHAKGNRYLHLSTHGYWDYEHAMYSGLLFSDGMLQTYEIFNMDIDAELTVLSACQTGLGELKAGEGLVGLTRAFMYAGSPSVLVSLWSVSDPSTAAFMKRFYRNLNKGKTKAEALRETKIWMKEKSYHTDEHGNVIKHDHPFYWAPFILVGAYE